MSSVHAISQEVIRGVTDRVKRISGGRFGGGGGGVDSLRHRDRNEDSITISFRYLDSTRSYKLDSSVNDFTRKYPVPATHIYLGNTGTATRSLLFSPVMTSGWDPGFHSFDVYRWKMDKVRFFTTTRPFSEIAYMIGSRVEQIIELFHTQNVRPNWNIMFNYRLINSPGFFKNQKTNHNNYLFNSLFQSKNKRYSNYFVILGNKLQATENGGIQDTADFLSDQKYKDRFNIPTKIGGDENYSSNFFSNQLFTGNETRDFSILIRQQYDLGKKDSLVTDSTVVPLFYPRLRFEHTFLYNKQRYIFMDKAHVIKNTNQFYTPDSAYYMDQYGIVLNPFVDTVLLEDRWKNIVNDFSIIQFPDAKNLHQFIKLGASLQNLTGTFSSGKATFYNVWGHAEYRNRTRNQLWDFEANGKLYLAGLNFGDYQAQAILQRFTGKKNGYVLLGFENSNRTPYFTYDSRSSFYLSPTIQDFKKENNTHLFASLLLPVFALKLEGHYYLSTNYTYITNFRELKQESSLFNFLQVAVQKTIKLGKSWFWHADVYLQKEIGDAPVHVPVFYTRNRIGYEGNLKYTNLNIAFGTEIRYRSPYKADNYSPALASFFFQGDTTIGNDLPDISFYMHFRIRPFKAFVRMENFNTLGKLNEGGVGFHNNSLVAPGYALPGLQFRLGIYWGFIN